MSHGNEMICQAVTLSGYAEWPQVADAVIEARVPPSMILFRSGILIYLPRYTYVDFPAKYWVKARLTMAA